jgi:hypothetical protein
MEFRGKDSADSKNKTTKTPFLRAHCGKCQLCFSRTVQLHLKLQITNSNLLDATAASCFKRLQLYFPHQAQNLMKERVRFLKLVAHHTQHAGPKAERPPSIWRPISTPVQDCPLAMCDFRSIDTKDLIPADIIFPHYQDEAYEVLPNPDQRWFYKKGMEWDDILLFKLGDNSPDEAPRKLILGRLTDPSKLGG